MQDTPIRLFEERFPLIKHVELISFFDLKHQSASGEFATDSLCSWKGTEAGMSNDESGDTTSFSTKDDEEECKLRGTIKPRRNHFVKRVTRSLQAAGLLLRSSARVGSSRLNFFYHKVGILEEVDDASEAQVSVEGEKKSTDNNTTVNPSTNPHASTDTKNSTDQTNSLLWTDGTKTTPSPSHLHSHPHPHSHSPSHSARPAGKQYTPADLTSALSMYGGNTTPPSRRIKVRGDQKNHHMGHHHADEASLARKQQDEDTLQRRIAAVSNVPY